MQRVKYLSFHRNAGPAGFAIAPDIGARINKFRRSAAPFGLVPRGGIGKASPPSRMNYSGPGHTRTE